MSCGKKKKKHEKSDYFDEKLILIFSIGLLDICDIFSIHKFSFRYFEMGKSSLTIYSGESSIPTAMNIIIIQHSTFYLSTIKVWFIFQHLSRRHTHVSWAGSSCCSLTASHVIMHWTRPAHHFRTCHVKRGEITRYLTESFIQFFKMCWVRTFPHMRFAVKSDTCTLRQRKEKLK